MPRVNDDAAEGLRRLAGRPLTYVEPFRRDAGDFWRALLAQARPAGSDVAAQVERR